MARNIEPAIRKALTAKLRERGLSTQAADAAATAHAAAALTEFRKALGAQVAPSETAYEQAFVAVAQFAAELKL
jgi:hypothetical protein